jgi:hypothetical protein
MYTLGVLLGSALPIWFLTWAVHRLVMHRFIDDPLIARMISIVPAWLVAGTLAGFGMADGGPFNYMAYVTYLIGAVIYAPFGYRRGLTLRRYEEEAGEGLAEKFR